jgi:hypothetical protein
MQQTLNAIHAKHGTTSLAHVRIFAQLWSLEPGQTLRPILHMQHFSPLSLTITIRHTDWWSWESDAHLSLSAQFIRCNRFPTSLLNVNLELESLARKKPQIDYIASRICQSWFLETASSGGGEAPQVMTAKEADCVTSTWTGTSIWNDARWIRDETEPETLEYYVKTVVFRMHKDTTTNEKPTSKRPDIRVPRELQPPIFTPHASIPTSVLRDAGLQAGATAEEALAAFNASGRGSRRRNRRNLF